MNYETISADEFGRSLSGVGVNILVKDVRRTVRFLERVFALKCHQVSNDFAIVSRENHVFQLHADHTKPHGLREAFIQCHDGYVWCPSKKS